MSDYLHPNGYTYSIEEVEMAAINAGVDYDEFVKLKGFAPTNKTKTQLKLYNKRIKIDFESTPTISAETMKLGEKNAKDKLIDKLGGLGYKIEERDDYFPGAQYIRRKYFGEKFGVEYGKATNFMDRLVVVAPDGVTEEIFEFDLDGIGLLFGNADDEANKLNEFIKKTINTTDINEEVYSQSWNYLDQRKNTQGKSFDKLSSEELQLEANNAYFELLNGNQRLPGVDRVYKEINTQLEPFVVKKINEIKQKYNLDNVSDPDQYDLAIEELNNVINAEHNRLESESKELVNIKVGIEKALEGKYGRTIDDQLRTEAENVHLPTWITQFDSDMARGLYTTWNIKFPKAWAEKNIMEDGVALKKVNDEIDRINDLISDNKQTLESPYSFRYDDSLTGGKKVKNPKTSKVFTNEDKLKELKDKKIKLNENLSYNFAEQKKYQKKLGDIRVPTAFGKDISDPDLTLDEWQNMLGDQIVQMLTSFGTVGYSTYAQEGGGAAFEIVEIAAAMKYYPSIPSAEDEFFGETPTNEVLELGPRQDAVNKAVDKLGEDAFNKMSDNEQKEYIDELMKQERMEKRAGGFSNYGNVSGEEFEAALKAFRELDPEKQQEIMLEVLNNGEIDLTPAVIAGLANAGLDFASTVVSFIPIAGGPATGAGIKALKFSSTSLFRQIMAKNVKGTLQALKPIAIASGTEVITEQAQEGVGISSVGYATGYYGNKEQNMKRFIEAGAQAFLTTGPVVGGGEVLVSNFKNARANYQAKNDPNHTRNSINSLKKGVNDAYKNNQIDIDERNDILDQLEAEEDIINTYTEYKSMDVNQKMTVIKRNVSNKKIQQQVAELQAENKKLKKESKNPGGIDLDVIKNESKIQLLQQKIRKNNVDIFTELKIVNDTKRSQFVEWINRNPDLVKGAKPIDFPTTAEAIEYFNKVLANLKEGKQTKKRLKEIEELNKGIDMLLGFNFTGKNPKNKVVNAFQFGKDVYSIKEMRHQLIRNNKGFGTPNAFHHDVLHVIQENMSLKELAAMQKEIVKQLGQTKDPALQKIFETAKEAFEIRYGNIKAGTKDYYLEWMANLSDTFAEFDVGNLTKESGISLTGIANFLSNTFHLKTKVGMDWGNFGPENALEHIKQYTNFHGQRKSLRIPTPPAKTEVDQEKTSDKKSRFSKAELDPITSLVPQDIKTLKDYQDFLSNRKAFMPVGKALQKNGLIYNIIRKKTTPETFQKTLDEVGERILKFNPEQLREDGTVVGIGAFAERVFSDLKYGKMDAAKEVATKKPTVSIDESTSSEGDRRFDIEDTSTDYVEDINYEKIESDFKRELGLNDELIEKSKAAARKTFGTKMPSLKNPRKYRKALKDAFVVELRAEVMKVFNTGKTYNNFLKKYIPLFHRQISADRWVQIERRVPKDKKIFVSSRRITSVKEVRKLQEQGLIRKDVKPATGPNLNKKLKTPSVEQIMAFFRGENMQDVLGYTVTESTLGTRKDGLADAVIEKVASRAAISVLNNERAVAELRRDVEEISSIEQIENDVEVMAAIVDEDPNVRYSEVTSLQITEQLLDLKNSIENKGFEATFNTDGKPKIKSTSGIWLEQIYEPLYDLGRKGLFTDRQANQTIKKIYGSFKIKGENNLGDVTERIIFDLFKEVGFLVDGHLLGEKKVNIPAFYTFKGGKFQNADIMFELDNGQQVALEIKFAADGTVNAGKIGVTSFNTKTGEFEYSSKDLNEDIKKITDEAIKGVIEVAKEIETLLVKEYGYPKGVSLNDVEFIHDPETLIARSPYNQKEIYRIDQSNGKTKWYQNDPKKGETGPDLKSLKAKSNIKVKDDGTVATYHYNKKGNFYILFVGEGAGKGMYYMGADPLETSKTLGTKRLKSNSKGFVFKGRLLSGRVVKNGVKIGYKLNISGESVINTNNMAETSAFNIRGKKDIKVFQKAVNSSAQAKLKLELAPIAEATKKARASKVAKGITILDFDDTLATSKSLVKYTKPDGTTGTLNAEQYAKTYEDLLDKGYVFDFSEFNKVVKGKIAPLFQKALKLQGKFGPKNMFVLTARPPQSQQAIFDFLSANGLNIPIENITGLGNSTAEAKALWVANKAAEGYNDFYFADDALQNVQAVKNMLNQFDVKSKIQQAKVRFSETMDDDFNKILEDITGIDAKKRFSAIKARKRGASKGKFRIFIPPSHEDFVGLLYNFMGKGRIGDAHRKFLEEALVRPLNRAFREIDAAKQAIANDYNSLNKQFKEVKKKFTKKTPDGDFVYEDAIRVYLWDKHGYEIPGLSETDQANLVAIVKADPELQAYAENLNVISKLKEYVTPTEGWDKSGSIKIDLIDATGRVGRAEYFTEFQENADIIFSAKNLNKIEAAYGSSLRSALEDMLYRIQTGINRPKGQSATVNKFMNYLNGSVGSVMFFNTRSALLQQLSIVNYINFADNNVYAAAKAFANQAQYWDDFAFIFNSDMLKQRRGGIQTDINGAELAQTVAKSNNKISSVIAKLLQLGFAPTQIADNIAIAIGGATFYRNRINMYIKEGMSKKEAESKAFIDFQDITNATQQSARPDMTSKQQASWIGKLILNFQNITSQYNRLIKKSALDIKNRRITGPNKTQLQSDLSNASRILYYGFVQNIIFYGLQTALFAIMFGTDDEEDDKKAEQIIKKKERIIQGTIDSILRGSGIYGAALSTIKNMMIKFVEQREKDYNPDESAVLMEFLNFSPVVGIKARKIVNAEKTLNYNKKVIPEMELLDIDNPVWSAVTNLIEATTNAPTNRLYNKTINLRDSQDSQWSTFNRVLMFSGYSKWNQGLGDPEVEAVKKKIKYDKELEKLKKKQNKSRYKPRTYKPRK